MGGVEEVNSLRTGKGQRAKKPEEDRYRLSEVKRAFIVVRPRYSGRGTREGA